MANQPAVPWRIGVFTNAARTLGLCIALTLACIGIAGAQARPEPLRSQSVMLFAGVFSKGNLGQAIVEPWHPHESNYIVGSAFALDLTKLGPNFVLGAEIGLAGRFGTNAIGSTEIWAGPTIRYKGFTLGDTLTIAPALILGFSVATASIGVESEREQKHGGTSSLLFRFTPELTFRLKTVPNLEFVYRIHHRSGLYGTLGDLKEGSNAHVFGIRWFR